MFQENVIYLSIRYFHLSRKNYSGLLQFLYDYPYKKIQKPAINQI